MAVPAGVAVAPAVQAVLAVLAVQVVLEVEAALVGPAVLVVAAAAVAAVVLAGQEEAASRARANGQSVRPSIMDAAARRARLSASHRGRRRGLGRDPCRDHGADWSYAAQPLATKAN
jgi:hypothetical protein